MKQEHKIKYCKTCGKFYTRSCSCCPNLVPKPAPLETCVYSILSLVRKFLYCSDTSTRQSHQMKNFLAKYIYLDTPSLSLKPKTKLDDVCVYMLTVTSEQNFERKESEKKLTPIVSPRSTLSTISVSSKKFTGGNIISNWINKTRKKKKKSDDCLSDTTLRSRAITEEIYFSEDEQSDHSSVQTQQRLMKVPSRSKIPVLKPNPSKMNFHKMMLLQKFTVKNVSVNQSDGGKCRSYVNIIPTQKQEESLKRSKSDADMEPLWKCSYADTNTPIYQLETFDLNAKLALDLHEVIAIMTQLKESEVHVAQLISKFIVDRSFQKQLLDIVAKHSKLHVSAELRTQNLTTEMWLYQNEVLKNQESVMQERLSTVINHNRILQNDIEQLMSKNEKLCIKIQHAPDNNLSSSDGAVLETISRNNDQLRHKLNMVQKQMEKGEIEFSKMQKKCTLLEQQLQNFNLQLQNYKDVIDRMHSESQLEQELLACELENSQNVLKKSAEAGDVVLEDLDSLKRQLKTMTCAINWTKFKCRGTSLPDLIYMCRSCINELSKELLHVQNERALKEKDIDSLKQEIARYEMEKEQAKTEHNVLQEKISSLVVKQSELQNYKIKYEASEEKLDKHKHDVQKVIEEYQKENRTLQKSVEKLEDLKKEVLEKNEELLLLKEQVRDYKSENDTLRMQLQGLKQVLSATGTGEVARELAETQEKLVAFQSQYYQILTEKNILIEKLQASNLEKTSLSQFQATSTQFIQTQQHELEKLKDDYLVLKQQLDLEQKQCIALTLERNKLREEKNVMRQVCSQFKVEVNRVQALEGKMAGINAEASRLALIADYNKQIGEKLQSEVAERDVKINELESNMKQLNNAQLENAKDKVALCVELKEVCTLNDRLSNTLEFEQQKIDELNQTKKQIEDAASLQLRAAEQMQLKERTALLELLKEYKAIVAQRDNLLKSQADQVQQITELRANIVFLSKNLEESRQKHMQEIEAIQILENNLMQSTEEIRKMTETINLQEQKNAKIKNQCLKAEEQKGTLEESVMYLKNTVQQLHRDLNKTRESETDVKRELESEKKKLKSLEEELDQQQRSLERASKDNDELVRKCTNLNTLYEELLQNYKHDTKMNNENVENLRQALSNSKEMVLHQKEEVEKHQKLVLEKETEVCDLKTKCNSYATQVSEMEKTILNSNLETQQLTESKMYVNLLEIKMDALREEYNESSNTIKALKEENSALQEKLEGYVESAKANCSFYEDYIKDMNSKHCEDRSELEQDLETFAIEFQTLRTKFVKEENQNKELTKRQKHLAEQLLTATQMVIDEKRKNQQANQQIENITQECQKLLAEKKQSDQAYRQSFKELNNLKCKIRDHICDKKKLHRIIAHLEKVQDDLQCDLNSSEIQLEEMQQKCERSEAICDELKATVEDVQKKLAQSQERVAIMKSQLDDNHLSIMNHESEISKLRQELIAVEFQKSEVTLRLHKLQASLKTEKSLNIELSSVNQKIVSEMLKIENNQSASPNLRYICDSESSSTNSHFAH